MTGGASGTSEHSDATPDDRIAGTHAPAANVYFRRVLPGFSVLFTALIAVDYVVDHHFLWWGPLMIATWLLQCWANVRVRAPRTVIGPAGLRVRTLLRWRDVPWADGHGVKDPTPWSSATMVIHTPAGEVTLPGLPTKQADELLAYARTHTAAAA